MISRSNLKESLSVDLKHGAFFSAGKIKWSKDGSVIYCPNLGSINVINVETGKPHVVIGVVSEDADIIHSFATTVDGSQLVSSHKSGLFKLWQLSDGCLLKQWKNIHKGPVADLDLSSGGLLASAGSDSVIRIWDLVHHSCTHALRGSNGVISVVKFHILQNENVVFGCGDDSKISCWSLEKNELLFQLSGHYNKVTSISISSDGNHMASSARDNVVMLWNLETRTCVKVFPVFESLEDVVCLPMKLQLPSIGELKGGIYVATAGEKGIIRIFDMVGGKELYSQVNSLVSSAPEKGGLSITQLLYNSYKNCFAVVTTEHNIIFHKTDTFDCIKQLAGFSDEILDLVFVGPDNSHVAVATNSRDIKLYNIETMGCQLLKGHTDIVLTLTSSLANHCWMLSGGKDNTIRLWELNPTNENMTCIGIGCRHTASVSSLSMSQMSTDFFYSTSQDTTLKLWTIQPLQSNEAKQNDYKLMVKSTEVAHQKDINTVAISPNDKLIATGSQDKTIKIWQADNLLFIGTLNGHRRGVWCIRFSPVDQIMLSASADTTIRIWSVADLSCLKTYEGHDASVLRAEFITSGMQILSTSGDGLVKLWNVKTGECSASFNEHEGQIWALAVSLNEKRIITGGSDSSLIIWRDSTDEKREEAAKAQEEIITNEQLLTNLLHNNKLFAALGVALSLDKPFKVLSIIKILMNKGERDHLRSTLKKLTDSEKEKLLECTSVWNSNSKNCDAAQLVLSIYLEEIACGELNVTKLPTFIEEVMPYTERHFRRLTGLLEGLHFLEYTMAVMKPELK
ncbi:hypothetical protein RUM43_007441 [Polyplax serrata]|uniref:U3 small nucleolar RNA-associated protein 13 C-terminal domain-containing protein n=1 Tax=Polyplax serrata TaxID=468196 RepID=A0AAN8PMM7_POLSC